MKTNTILEGNALEKLKELPDVSINCCMTSPPYWALRDYGTEPMIWDGKKDCEHNFDISNRYLHRGSTKSTVQASIDKIGGIPSDWKVKDGFCSKCNAWKGNLGLEPTFDLYIKHLCDIFDEVKRVLKKDGSCWVNIGDTYYGNPAGDTSGKSGTGRMKLGYADQETRIKGTKNKAKRLIAAKSLCNIPARFSIEMQNRGWILRNVIIWHKPNCMPSSVKDRFTVDFEYLFFFVKSKKYWFERQKEKSITGKSQNFNFRVRDVKRGFIKSSQYKASQNEVEKYHGGNIVTQEFRNVRSVWTITTKPFKESHFATYPEEFCETPLKAGCQLGGIVLDPFFGAGTTGLVALKQNKKFIGIELNPKYIEIANKRLQPYLEQQTFTDLIPNNQNNQIGESN